MILLDATYRTSRYALPLFFLCVRTNVAYAVVAAFIIEREDSRSIEEALAVIQDWNRSFHPRNIMVDFSSAEISAVEAIWPGEVKRVNSFAISDNCE